MSFIFNFHMFSIVDKILHDGGSILMLRFLFIVLLILSTQFIVITAIAQPTPTKEAYAEQVLELLDITEFCDSLIDDGLEEILKDTKTTRAEATKLLRKMYDEENVTKVVKDVLVNDFSEADLQKLINLKEILSDDKFAKHPLFIRLVDKIDEAIPKFTEDQLKIYEAELNQIVNGEHRVDNKQIADNNQNGSSVTAPL